MAESHEEWKARLREQIRRDVAEAYELAPEDVNRIAQPGGGTIAYLSQVARANSERDEDDLPRRRRNPRIGCEQHENGTWIHGRPHTCPKWTR